MPLAEAHGPTVAEGALATVLAQQALLACAVVVVLKEVLLCQYAEIGGI